MISSFFNSTNHDRTYSAEDFADYFSKFVGNGVFADPATALQVSSGGGLNINVDVGSCFINGYMGRATETETVVLTIGYGTYSRLDLIVARLDFTQRDIHIEVITGTPSVTPVMPAMVRNSVYYDICLAVITVGANVTNITDADITDTRFDTAICGIVTSAVETIDTTELFKQYEAAWELLLAGFSGSEEEVIAAFEALNAVKTVNGKPPTNGDIALAVGDLVNSADIPKFTVIFDGTVAADTDITLSAAITDFEYIAFTPARGGIYAESDTSTYIDAEAKILPSEFIAGSYGYHFRDGCYDNAITLTEFKDAVTVNCSRQVHLTVFGINRIEEG